MSHPYKDKACGGRAMAAKRYADGGGLYGDSDGPTGHPTGGADQYKPDMNMINKGLGMIQKGGEAPSGGDQDFLKLKFMDLKPAGKARGGSAELPRLPKLPTTKMPMKLKMMKLKGMK